MRFVNRHDRVRGDAEDAREHRVRSRDVPPRAVPLREQRADRPLSIEGYPTAVIAARSDASRSHAATRRGEAGRAA